MRDLPELLRRGDQVVVNDTKVIPARLVGLRDTGGAVEAELDAVLDEAGEAPLETPSGTLRRVVEGGARRFVLDV